MQQKEIPMAPVSSRPSTGTGLSAFRLQRAGVVYALVVVVLVFQVLTLSKGLPGFLSITNARNILDQSALDGVLVVSMTALLITGNFDLSVGATAGLSAATGLTVANSHGILLGTLTALGVGVGVGVINGVLVHVVGVNAFIVTLGTLTAVQGLLLIATSANTVLAKSGQFGAIGTTLQRLSPAAVIIAGAVLLIYAVLRVTGRTGARQPGLRLDSTSVTAGILGLLIIGVAVGLPALTSHGSCSGTWSWGAWCCASPCWAGGYTRSAATARPPGSPGSTSAVTRSVRLS
jgi:predicted ABC-type sugar transport system permease subunit